MSGGGGGRIHSQGAIRAEWRNQVSFLEGESEPDLGAGGRDPVWQREKWGNGLMMALSWQEREELPPTPTPLPGLEASQRAC